MASKGDHFKFCFIFTSIALANTVLLNTEIKLNSLYFV